MAIKFEKVQPGMTLIDIHSERAGNTTMRRTSWWPVYIVSVDRERETAIVSWNGNPDHEWRKRRIEKLYRDGSPAVKRVQEREQKGWF